MLRQFGGESFRVLVYLRVQMDVWTNDESLALVLDRLNYASVCEME